MSIAYLSMGAGNALAEGHPYSTRAPDRDNTTELADLLARMDKGLPFERAELPRLLLKTEGRATRRCLVSTGFTILDARAADVVGAHDLGDGFLWEMTVSERDGRPVGGAEPWFGLHIGAVKDSLDVTASTGLKKAFGNLTLKSHPLEIGEAQLTVSPEADQGAAVWRELKIRRNSNFFINAPLREALKAAGLASDFDLIPCLAA